MLSGLGMLSEGSILPRLAVERFIDRVKQCRRIATRSEKTARNYQAFWHLASIMILLA